MSSTDTRASSRSAEVQRLDTDLPPAATMPARSVACIRSRRRRFVAGRVAQVAERGGRRAPPGSRSTSASSSAGRSGADRRLPGNRARQLRARVASATPGAPAPRRRRDPAPRRRRRAASRAAGDPRPGARPSCWDFLTPIHALAGRRRRRGARRRSPRRARGARREIVLRCGEASITLRRNGRIASAASTSRRAPPFESHSLRTPSPSTDRRAPGAVSSRRSVLVDLGALDHDVAAALT